MGNGRQEQRVEKPGIGRRRDGERERERERGAVSAGERERSGELRLARVRERWVGSHSAGYGMGVTSAV